MRELSHGTSAKRMADVCAVLRQDLHGGLYRWFPSVLKAMTIIRPETFVR
jgi:hypothetical protein